MRIPDFLKRNPIYHYLKRIKYLRNLIISLKHRYLSYFVNRYGLLLLQEIYSILIDDVIVMPRSGTLLGLYRDGKLIRHDCDLDLVLYDVSCGAGIIDFSNKALALGYKITHIYKYGKKQGISLLKKNINININVSLYDYRNNSWTFSVVDSKKNLKSESNIHYEKFPLEYLTISIEELELKIPKYTESLLESWYGSNWQIPDSFLNEYYHK